MSNVSAQQEEEVVGGHAEEGANTAGSSIHGTTPAEEVVVNAPPPRQFHATTTLSTLTNVTGGSSSTGAASQDFLMEIVAARGGTSGVGKKETSCLEEEEEDEEPHLSQINRLISALNDHIPEEEPADGEEEPPPPPAAVGAFGVRPRRRNTTRSSDAGGGTNNDDVNNAAATSSMPEIYPAAGESRNPGSFNTSLPVADGVTIVDETTTTTTNTTTYNSSSLVRQRIRDAEEHGRRTVLLEAAPAQVVTPQLLQLNRKNTKMPQFQTPELEKRFQQGASSRPEIGCRSTPDVKLEGPPGIWCPSQSHSLQHSSFFTLRFVTPQQEHDSLFLSALAVFRPLAVVANLGFFGWDCIQPNDPPLIKCFFVKIISLAIFFPLTMLCHKYPHRFSQFGCLAMLVISTQISVSLYLIDDGFVLGAGGYGVILVPSCCGLRFNWSVAGCIGTLFIANALGIMKAVVHREDPDAMSFEPHYVFIHLNMFIGIYCLFGLFFSYAVEWHLRQRFQANGTIFGWSFSSTTNDDNSNPTQQQQQPEAQSNSHHHHHNSATTSSNQEE